MLSILLAILALCLLVIIHEFGHFIVARLCNMRVERFSLGFGPALWSKKIGETIYQVSPILLGGYVQIAGLNPDDESSKQAAESDPRSYHNRPGWQRFLVVLAGPFINYLFAFIVVLGLGLALGVPSGVDGVMIGYVKPGSVAAASGLQVKDQVVSVNGVAMVEPENFVSQIQNSQGKPVTLQIHRGTEDKRVVVTPIAEEGTYRIGVRPMTLVARQHIGFISALRYAVEYPIALTWAQIEGLKRIFSDRRAVDDVGGPVQIVSQIKTQIRAGWVDALEIMALISVALGFFNLLPIPALDGGRLLFLAWEIITRRPVPKKAEQWVHIVGMVLLLILFVLITSRDIFRLIKGML